MLQKSSSSMCREGEPFVSREPAVDSTRIGHSRPDRERDGLALAQSQPCDGVCSWPSCCVISTPMKLSRRFLRFCSCIVFACAASPAMAQDRLFIGDVEVGAIGHFGEIIGPISPLVQGEFIAGGRYVVDQPGHVIDTSTGSVASTIGGTPVAFDRSRPRVFFYRDAAVWVHHVPSGHETRLTSAPNFDSPIANTGTNLRAEFSLASSRDEMFIRRGGLSAVPELAVIDATSGVLKRTMADIGVFPSYELVASQWGVSADGTRLFAIIKNAVGTDSLRSVNAATSAVINETNAGRAFQARLATDPLSDHVFYNGYLGHDLWAFDRDARLVGRVVTGFCGAIIRVSPHTGRVYLLRNTDGGGGYYGAIDTRLTVFDGGTGQMLADRSVTDDLGLSKDRPVCGQMSLALLTAPGAPGDLMARVEGSTVSLSWLNVGGASTFVLEAGFAPNRTALAVTLGPEGTATFTDVPAGTYYVRVRGGNKFGGGRPSSELTVVVP